MVVAGTARREDGEPVLLLESERTPDVSDLERGVVPENATDLRDWTVTAGVDERGRVLQFSVTAKYTLRDQEGALDVQYSVLRLESGRAARLGGRGAGGGP
jgi:hypothetical protein